MNLDRVNLEMKNIFKNGVNIQRLSRNELLRLSMDLIRFPNVNHVEIRTAQDYKFNQVPDEQYISPKAEKDFF